MLAILAEEEERIKQEVIEPVREDICADFETRPKTEKAVIHLSAVCARTGTPEDIRLTYLAHLMTVGGVDDHLTDAFNAGLQAMQSPLP